MQQLETIENNEQDSELTELLQTLYEKVCNNLKELGVEDEIE